MKYRTIVLCVLLLAGPVRGDTPENPALEALRELALPLAGSEDLTPLIKRIGDARLVLLGEASHGTSEFYTWRAALTKRLLQEQAFNFVVVEGDWEFLYRLNRYVKGWDAPGDSARAIMREFSRWPTWMWANEETADLIEWMRAFNQNRPPDARVGFYGLDVYGETESLRVIREHLADLDEALQAASLEVLECFERFGGSFHDYARAVAFGAASCEALMQDWVEAWRRSMDGLEGQERADAFAFKMNAKVVKGAEAHFRLMARQGPDSWNARVDHFYAVADRLLQFYGASARGIVWAHNTHIGDARFTTSGQRGERNIGQVARQRLGEEQVVAVGFGTHRGTVQAGRAWGGPMETMQVPPGAAGSLEALMHQLAMESALFIFDDRAALAPLMEVIGHRAIGVIYHPEREVPGNYVPTIVPRRYDAFIFIDETKALQPVAP